MGLSLPPPLSDAGLETDRLAGHDPLEENENGSPTNKWTNHCSLGSPSEMSIIITIVILIIVIRGLLLLLLAVMPRLLQEPLQTDYLEALPGPDAPVRPICSSQLS